MKVTKYDIADVLLVCLCVSYIPMVFVLFCMQVAMMVQEMPHLVFTDGIFLTIVFFQFGYYFIACIVLYFLILKRKPIIKLFFRESEAKELTIPDGLTILIHYSFWIRLSGILMMLREGTNLIKWVTSEVFLSQIEERQTHLFATNFQSFVGVGLGLLIIWKADWIAEKVKRLAPTTSRNVIDENLMDDNETNTPADAYPNDEE